MQIQEKILTLVRENNSDLPTLSFTLNKIISVASDRRSTVEELEKAITFDQAMTSKLLKLSNSMYYAQKSKVDTIKRAISVIGFDEIIGIALGMEILSSFNKASGKKFNLGSLWMHSIGVATVSKELSKKINPDDPNKIFIPALLHDMGKVFLSAYFENEYNKVQEFAFDRKKPLHMAENAILKLNHAVLSALLMKRWKFPPSIELPCRFHHNPESSPLKFRQEAFILNIADYVALKAGIGGRGPAPPVLNKNALEITGLNQLRLELIIDQLRKREQEIKDFFKITSES